MATAKKSTAKKSSAKSSAKKTTAKKPAATARAGKTDATVLLQRDHADVKKLFRQYEKLADNEADGQERQALAMQICQMLTVHATIEEEIFYPEERGDVEEDMLDEAYVEHAGAKQLIAEIEAMKPGDEYYDAKVKVLGEYIKHHVKEEEQPGGIFAQAKKGDEDLDAMGERLKARKEELTSKLAPVRAN